MVVVAVIPINLTINARSGHADGVGGVEGFDGGSAAAIDRFGNVARSDGPAVVPPIGGHRADHAAGRSGHDRRVRQDVRHRLCRCGCSSLPPKNLLSSRRCWRVSWPRPTRPRHGRASSSRTTLPSARAELPPSKPNGRRSRTPTSIGSPPASRRCSAPNRTRGCGRWPAKQPIPEPYRVLDIGAGTGRNALALARRGHPVDAVEMTPKFADIIRAEAEREALDVRVIQRDVFATMNDLRGDYRLIVLSEVVSDFRTTQQLRGVFELADRCLAPGGRLVFNAFLARHGYIPDDAARELGQQVYTTIFTQDENWRVRRACCHSSSLPTTRSTSTRKPTCPKAPGHPPAGMPIGSAASTCSTSSVRRPRSRCAGSSTKRPAPASGSRCRRSQPCRLWWLSRHTLIELKRLRNPGPCVADPELRLPPRSGSSCLAAQSCWRRS